MNETIKAESLSEALAIFGNDTRDKEIYITTTDDYTDYSRTVFNNFVFYEYQVPTVELNRKMKPLEIL